MTKPTGIQSRRAAALILTLPSRCLCNLLFLELLFHFLCCWSFSLALSLRGVTTGWAAAENQLLFLEQP